MYPTMLYEHDEDSYLQDDVRQQVIRHNDEDYLYSCPTATAIPKQERLCRHTNDQIANEHRRRLTENEQNCLASNSKATMPVSATALIQQGQRPNAIILYSSSGVRLSMSRIRNSNARTTRRVALMPTPPFPSGNSF